MSRLSNILQSVLFLSGKAVEESFIKEKLQLSAKEMKDAVAQNLGKYLKA